MFEGTKHAPTCLCQLTLARPARRQEPRYQKYIHTPIGTSPGLGARLVLLETPRAITAKTRNETHTAPRIITAVYVHTVRPTVGREAKLTECTAEKRSVRDRGASLPSLRLANYTFRNGRRSFSPHAFIFQGRDRGDDDRARVDEGCQFSAALAGLMRGVSRCQRIQNGPRLACLPRPTWPGDIERARAGAIIRLLR